MLLVIGGMALLNLVGALAPPLGSDDLIYHFVGPQRYLDAHKIIFIPDKFVTNLPFTMEMLWTAAIAIDSGELAQVANWSIGLLVLPWIVLIGRHAGLGLRGIVLAVVLFYSISAIAHLSESGNVGLGSTVFVLASVFALLQWQPERRLQWLFWPPSLRGYTPGPSCRM